MADVVIVEAVRTPVGRRNGALSSVHPADLLGTALTEVVDRSGIDPAAIFAGNGSLRMSIEAMHASMPQSLAHFFALGVPGILLEADGRVFHNAGATDTQELGIMLASALAYLRMFEEARQPVLYAAAHVGFATSLGLLGGPSLFDRLETGDIVAPKLDTTEPLRMEAMHFLDCVRTGERPITDAVAGLRPERVAGDFDRILQVLNEGGTHDARIAAA